MYGFLLVTNSNFGRICYRFQDIDVLAAVIDTNNHGHD